MSVKSGKVTHKEHTEIENVVIVKYENNRNYFARKYYPTDIDGNVLKKYVHVKLSDNLEKSRIKVKHVEIPDYKPRGVLVALGAKLNNQRYTYIPKDPKIVGIHAEQLFAGLMYEQGYEIYEPKYDKWAADFVVWKHGIYHKVQVKSSNKKMPHVTLCTSDGRLYRDRVDYLAFFSFY